MFFIYHFPVLISLRLFSLFFSLKYLGHDIQSDTLVRSCLDSVAAVHNVYSSMLVSLSAKKMRENEGEVYDIMYPFLYLFHTGSCQ